MCQQILLLCLCTESKYKPCCLEFGIDIYVLIEKLQWSEYFPPSIRIFVKELEQMTTNLTRGPLAQELLQSPQEQGRSIHEIDKIRERLEAEKMELQAALEKADGALEALSLCLARTALASV